MVAKRWWQRDFERHEEAHDDRDQGRDGQRAAVCLKVYEADPGHAQCGAGER
jgi:hypothetical protein